MHTSPHVQSIRLGPKRPRRTPILGSCCLLLAATLGAHSVAARSDVNPVNPDSALAELVKIEQTRERSTATLRREAIATLQQAAASGSAAAKLYEKATEGAGQPNFSEWKKKNSDLLRSRVFQEALQLRWHYLALSLGRGEDNHAARWAEPSLRYAGELSRWMTEGNFRRAPGPARDALKKPIVDDPFTQWHQLAPLLPAARAWEQSPGNLAGILETNVRLPWRAAADPRLDTSWQLELDTASALARASSSPSPENYENLAAPSLRFRRALDQAATGQPNRAAADLLNLARRHPSHPDFPQWAAALREMLGNKAPLPASP
jgi:hypothetical protein